MEAVLFSSYFPCIQYVSKFLLHDKIIIDIHENYQRQTYRNRCRIQAANGVYDLSIPVKKNHHKKIKDVEIDYSELWQKNHSRAILSAYKNSAFYEYYIDEFNFVFSQNHKFLIDINQKILDKTISILKIKSRYSHSKDFINPSSLCDYRELITPKGKNTVDDLEFKPQTYIQVFSERHGFNANLSILDLIFNEGPASIITLQKSIATS
ncbi:MAG: WbqC family protein [Bacteroidales bacterium]|nr:WbqC family protein [Bacteroidales bacterium]